VSFCKKSCLQFLILACNFESFMRTFSLFLLPLAFLESLFEGFFSRSSDVLKKRGFSSSLQMLSLPKARVANFWSPRSIPTARSSIMGAG
jgi:hypothetical protein